MGLRKSFADFRSKDTEKVVPLVATRYTQEIKTLKLRVKLYVLEFRFKE